jgi:hypothetical protein
LLNLAPTRAGIFESEKIEERREKGRVPMMMRFAGAAVAVALLLGVAVAAGAGQDGACARRSSPPFLDAIGSRCPFVRIEPSPPLEVGARLLPSAAALSDSPALRIVVRVVFLLPVKHFYVNRAKCPNRYC